MKTKKMLKQLWKKAEKEHNLTIMFNVLALKQQIKN